MSLLKYSILLSLILNFTTVYAENNSSANGNASGDINDEAYNKKVFELSAILYGVLEIGGKSCKAAGAKMPSSLEAWWKAVGDYQKGETSLGDKLSKDKADLMTKLDQVSKDKTADKQLSSMQLTVESMDIGINGIQGPNGRIELRQKLLAALNDAIKANEKEQANNLKAYKNLSEKAYASALDSAKRGCERKKKVDKCTTDNKGNKTCVKVDVLDPVPGCDVALAKLPELKADTLKKYEDLYLMPQVPSLELNNKMEDLEKNMQETMASIPKSNDANFDWSTDMNAGIAEVSKARKDAGIKCPSSADDQDLDRTKLDTIVPDKNAVATMPEQVSGGAEKFLSLIGTNNVSADVTKTFTKSWNLADTVVGQPGQRPAYFNYVTERVNELMAMDQAYLSRAIDNRTKYADYAANVKNQLTDNAGLNEGGSASGNGGSASNEKNKPLPVSISDNGNNGAMAAAISNNTKANNFQMGTTATSSDSSTKLAIENRGAVSGNSVSAFSQQSGNSAAISKVVGVKTNSGKTSQDTIENSKIKSLNDVQNEKSTNTETGLKTANTTTINSGKTLSNADKILRDKFNDSFQAFSETKGAKEIYKVAASRAFKNEASDSSSALAKANEELEKEETKKAGYKNNYQPIVPDKKKDKSAAKVAAKTKKTSADTIDLAEAIKAKKAKNKNAYNAEEDDSLFNKVTKAYIRNYEKVDNTEEQQ